MASFGKGSLGQLARLHADLRRVLEASIAEFDFAVIQSTRSREEQEQAFQHHCSKAHFGQSAHNYTPSFAVDCVPFPIDWNDANRFAEMASVILKHAALLNVSVTWGGHWTTLKDLPHFELTNWRQIARANNYVGV